MRLGKRLEKILTLINTKVGVVADIGTDHGILAYKILNQNKARRVIATDISAPSLEKAIKLKHQFNLGDEFRCLVGDGLKPLLGEEFIDIAIIAGVGGNEAVKILTEKPKEVSVGSYILQPMQDNEILRQFLIESGYEIMIDETVKDRDKFYSTIQCKLSGVKKNATIEEVVVGKTDRMNRGDDFNEWLDAEIAKQVSREKYLNEAKKKRLLALKKIKLENEEKNNI